MGTFASRLRVVLIAVCTAALISAGIQIPASVLLHVNPFASFAIAVGPTTYTLWRTMNAHIS